MNPRQSVLIAMFLSVAVYMLANARASSILTSVGSLKQVPASVPVPAPPVPSVDQRITGGARNI